MPAGVAQTQREHGGIKSLKASRHFALDKVAHEKLMERGSLNLWDNGNVSKDWAFRKKVDDLGKNVDDHGASCLGGPSVPGMLADVDGRVVPRPAVESVCESGSKGSSARTRTEMRRGRRWEQVADLVRHAAELSMERMKLVASGKWNLGEMRRR